MARSSRRRSKDQKLRNQNHGQISKSQNVGGTQSSTNVIASIYASNPKLVEDAGRLSFAQALGTPFTFGNYSVVNTNNTIVGMSLLGNHIPGAVRLALEPSYGGTILPNSPINLATRKIYSFVRHANSGRSNYEAADLMLYLLQMNEILSLYSWFARLYGISRLYNGKNRYYPKRIIESMGVDFDDLIENLATFRFQLNVFATKIASLNVPAHFPLFKQSINMFSQLFLDGTDDKAQTYYFDISRYYKFDATSHPNGGMLKLEPWAMPEAYGKSKVRDLIKKMNDLLDVVLQDEDMNIMSGDILKAYGPDSVITLPQIQDDSAIIPVYDESALDMIRNASLTYRTPDSADITQQDQLLTSTPRFVTTSPTNTLGKIISLNVDNPQPLDVLMSTRLSLITPATSTAAEGLHRKFISEGVQTNVKTGSHILTGIQVVTDVGEISITLDPLFDSSTMRNLNQNAYYTLTYPTLFKSFPLQVVWLVDENQRYKYAGLVGDVQNYTILSKEDLDKQHETALLSLFGI